MHEQRFAVGDSSHCNVLDPSCELGCFWKLTIDRVCLFAVKFYEKLCVGGTANTLMPSIKTIWGKRSKSSQFLTCRLEYVFPRILDGWVDGWMNFN